MDPGGISKETIDNLALKYAPLVLLDGKEEYLPASIAYLQNWDDVLNSPIDDCNVNVTLTKPIVRSVIISNGFNDPGICTPQELMEDEIYEE